MAYTPGAYRLRETVVLALICLILFFWIFPITALASLLSYKEIRKVMPWLADLIDKNDKIRAIVQNSLPSVAMISLNAMLPSILECEPSYTSILRAFLTCAVLTYQQGYRARSWIEYSLLKK
jgi:calcium permeable stress-gated cation channel